MKRIVGIGELIVSTTPEDLLITYALGSCLGIAVSDIDRGIGGLIHCQLPTAKSSSAKDSSTSAQFVDSGVLALLDEMLSLGADKRRLVIKVAGGIRAQDNLNLFKIAERNYTVLRKLLWKNNLLIEAEDVGGTSPRTMSLDVSSGRVVIQSLGREYELEKSAAFNQLPTHCANPAATVTALCFR